MSQQVIGRGSAPNDGTGDTPYIATGKVNANFTELYTAITSPLVLSNVTGALGPSIAAKTKILSIYIAAVSGSPTVKCGTTVGGNDIFDTIPFASLPLEISIDSFSYASRNIYFTVASGNVNMQVDLKTVTV